MTDSNHLNTFDDIDWNQIWMARQQRSRDAGRGGGCPSAWQGKRAAAKYWENVRNSPRTQDRVNEVLSFCNPESRLLDVGAGPGTLAIPLAARVRHITAVEPADGMVEVLRDNVNAGAIQNIHIVHKAWDDIDIAHDLHPPYDVTVASFSMGMLDLRKTIQDMLAVTSGVIILYWHVGDQPFDAEATALWPLLHNKEHYPVPKSDILFQVLCQMGIYPHVTPMRSMYEQTFESFEAMLDEYAERYEVTTEEGRRLLADYLAARHCFEGDRCVIRAQRNSMKLWWAVDDVEPRLRNSTREA